MIHDDVWIFTSMDAKNWQSNILHLRFKIYSLKLQPSHQFPIIASNETLNNLKDVHQFFFWN